MKAFNSEILAYQKLINDNLEDFLPNSNVPYGKVIEAMKYSLIGSGKRIRAVLVLAFYDLFTKGEKTTKNALPFAAGLEMIHCYSLIHDDLPCMDDDDIRRGNPSNHIAFGEATALLAGDGLLTLAFETFAKQLEDNTFSADQIAHTVLVLAKSAGVNGMIGGQILDLQNESKSATIEEVTKAENKKTGELFKAAALIGSILGGATNKQQGLVAEYAKNIGLTFQIVDDILDKTSTLEKLGKPIDSDKQQSKSTFTTIYGVEKAQQIADLYTSKALEILGELNGDISFLEGLTNYLAKRDY